MFGTFDDVEPGIQSLLGKTVVRNLYCMATWWLGASISPGAIGSHESGFSKKLGLHRLLFSAVLED
jgi:hypothetical protein